MNDLVKRLREYAGFDPDKALMHSQAADEIERLERVSELKSARIAELERELFGEDMSAVTMVDLLQEQLAACQKEQDKSLRHYVAKELREMAGDEFQGVNIGWRYKLRRRADELENGK